MRTCVWLDKDKYSQKKHMNGWSSLNIKRERSLEIAEKVLISIVFTNTIGLTEYFYSVLEENYANLSHVSDKRLSKRSVTNEANINAPDKSIVVDRNEDHQKMCFLYVQEPGTICICFRNCLVGSSNVYGTEFFTRNTFWERFKNDDHWWNLRIFNQY